MLHYSTGAERQHWDGTPSTELVNDARPMFHNPKFGQLHVAIEDFRGDLGRSLQAHYLEEYGLTDGERISQLLDDHLLERDELFRELDDYLDDLNRELRWYGLSVDDLGRDIQEQVTPILQKGPIGRAKVALSYKTRGTVVRELINGIYNAYKELTGASDGTGRSHNKYPNRSLHQYYGEKLESDDFPEEVRSSLTGDSGK
jgi:hypothetical protein